MSLVWLRARGARFSRAALRAALAVSLLLPLAVPSANALAQKKGAAPARGKKDKPKDYSAVNLVLETSQGEITIKPYFDKAPNHVKAMIDLAASGFYDGTLFHRVIPGFIVQTGDPLTKDTAKMPVWGTGGATDAKGNKVTLKAEFSPAPHRRGVVSMAHAVNEPDSASSQFFIVVKDSPLLDGQWTAVGEVVAGLEVVDKIVAESNADTADRSGGKPRTYQKLVRARWVDAAATPSFPLVGDAPPAPAPTPAPR